MAAVKPTRIDPTWSPGFIYTGLHVHVHTHAPLICASPSTWVGVCPCVCFALQQPHRGVDLLLVIFLLIIPDLLIDIDVLTEAVKQ